jgi:hypothetical protein
MSLAKGNTLSAVDGNGAALTDPDTGEAISYEVLEHLGPMSVHDPKTGEFSHELAVLLVKRLGGTKEIDVPVTRKQTVPTTQNEPTSQAAPTHRAPDTSASGPAYVSPDTSASQGHRGIFNR